MSLNDKELSQIHTARKRLISEGLLKSSTPSVVVPLAIEQSWRRSISLGVNPEATPRLLEDFSTDETFLSAANRVLDQWSRSLESSNLTLLLSDSHGRIIARRTNDARDARNLDHVNAVEGSDFSEKSVGTNGLGTSLEGQDIVIVRGPEHYNEALSTLICSGIPVTHPITGRLIGSLSISAPLDAPENIIKAITRQVALQVSHELEHLTEAQDRNLVQAFRSFKASQRPILVMNSQAVLSEYSALPYLDTDFHSTLWNELQTQAWPEDTNEISVPLKNAKANVKKVSGSTDPILAIEFVDEPREINAPKLTKETTPDSIEDATSQLSKYAEGPGLIRILGPRGIGKKFLARTWLLKQTTKQPFSLTVTAPTGEDIPWGLLRHALDEGQSLIISTDQPIEENLVHQLNSLAIEFDRLAKIVLTQRIPTQGTEFDSTEEIKTLTLAGLSGNTSKILQLLKTVASHLFPHAPAPRFSPNALTQLINWPWPGNTDELTQLIQQLPQIPRGQVVQLHHLPIEIQQYAGEGSGRAETAERNAIINALHTSNGNKSEAAEILKIGRTTLYRKIKSLGINMKELGITSD